MCRLNTAVKRLNIKLYFNKVLKCDLCCKNSKEQACALRRINGV